MTDALAQNLRASGRLPDELVTQWLESSELLAGLDFVGREGGSVVVKIDGGRTNGLVYTVVVSGGRLGQKYFHKDSAVLADVLREALEFYLAKISP
jgi:hypothetical protein